MGTKAIDLGFGTWREPDDKKVAGILDGEVEEGFTRRPAR